VQAYVPGYRLKQQVQFEVIPEDKPVNLPGVGRFSGLKTAVYLEVEGRRTICLPTRATSIL
jgi:acetaldehyde dehydrogenase